MNFIYKYWCSLLQSDYMPGLGKLKIVYQTEFRAQSQGSAYIKSVSVIMLKDGNDDAVVTLMKDYTAYIHDIHREDLTQVR